MKTKKIFFLGLIIFLSLLFFSLSNNVQAQVCGDGAVNQNNEECDFPDYSGQDCPGFINSATGNYYTGGFIGCDPSNCHFDLSGCTEDGTCGDNAVNQNSEDCDGTDLQGQQCSGFINSATGNFYTGGTLLCDSSCHFGFSFCSEDSGGGGSTSCTASGGTCATVDGTTGTCASDGEGGFFCFTGAGGGANGNSCNYNSDCASDCCDNSTVGSNFTCVATSNCTGGGGTTPITTTLQNGSTGSEVSTLQRLLTQAGLNPGTIDGNFGSLTEAAVRQFQASAGLPVTGIVDAATRAALNTAAGSGTIPVGSGIFIPTPAQVGLPGPAGGIQAILVNLLKWIVVIFGVLAMIAFFISGTQYVLASGSEKTIETAKRNMTYSIIGVIVGLSGYIIIRAVEAALSASPIF